MIRELSFWNRVSFILFLLTASLSTITLAQNYNADSIFTEARKIAFQGDYAKAIELCHEILKNKPEYDEVALFMARVYGWDKQYGKAAGEARKLIDKQLKNKEAWQALIDFAIWAEKPDSAISIIDSALIYFPEDSIFLYKKAELYFNKGDYTKSKEIIHELLTLYPDHQKAKELLQKIKRETANKILSPDYYFHLFNTPFQWRLQIVTLDYGFKIRKGTYFAGISIGDLRIDQDHPAWQKPAFQFKLELYPRINEKQYAFVNYSYGINGIFPRHRFGLEFHQQLSKSFEISAGLRYLIFPYTDTVNKAIIYTASVTYQKNQYWFNLRPYFSKTRYGYGQSVAFEMRKFLNSDDRFATLYAGIGNNPDELRNNSGSLEIYQLNSYKLLLGLQTRLLKNHLVLIKSGLSLDEYKDNDFRLSYELFVKFYFRH